MPIQHLFPLFQKYHEVILGEQGRTINFIRNKAKVKIDVPPVGTIDELCLLAYLV